MRLALRVLVAVLGLLLVAALVLWRSLAPPSPLAIPESGAVLGPVTLVTPGLERRDDVEVRVVGSRIHSIVPADGDAEAGPYAGAYVLPGLVDMHVHFPPASPLGQAELFSFLFLYHGVTSVRDAGDADGTATAVVRDGIANGDFPGPRVFACGPFVDDEPATWPNTRVLEHAVDARLVVEEIAEAGFDCVKVYNNLSAKALAAVRRAAAERGLPVIGHVSRFVSYEDAQLDDVQHMTRMPVSPVGDERGFPALMTDWADLDQARIDTLVQTSLEHGIANTPTLVTTEQLLRMQDYESLRTSPEALLLPRLYRDVLWSPTEGLPFLRNIPAEEYRALADAREPRMRVLRALHRAGARLHAGTDVQTAFVVPGISLHQELRLLVEAGLSPEEAWAAATRVPGEFLDPGLGRLRAGAPADLLVFREDPSRDLAALDTLEAVVAQGRLYDRADLHAQLERYRAWWEDPIFDAVSATVTRRLLSQLQD